MDDELFTLDRMEVESSDRAGTVELNPDTDPNPLDQSSVLPADELPALAEHDGPADDQPSEPAVAAHPGAATQPLATIVEALLFSADTPLGASRLAELIGGCTANEVRLAISALNDKYTLASLSFRIEEIARGFQMLTLPRFQPWVARLNAQRAQTRLTGAALETVSIIAYKQPIIRADVEAIRGVACGEVLNRLREMGLVRIVGRAEVVGRPLLYGTTRKFLDVFGLADLDDLPPIEALAVRRREDRTAEPEPALTPAVAAPAPAMAASA